MNWSRSQSLRSPATDFVKVPILTNRFKRLGKMDLSFERKNSLVDIGTFQVLKDAMHLVPICRLLRFGSCHALILTPDRDRLDPADE